MKLTVKLAKRDVPARREMMGFDKHMRFDQDFGQLGEQMPWDHLRSPGAPGFINITTWSTVTSWQGEVCPDDGPVRPAVVECVKGGRPPAGQAMHHQEIEAARRTSLPPTREPGGWPNSSVPHQRGTPGRSPRARPAARREPMSRRRMRSAAPEKKRSLADLRTQQAVGVGDDTGNTQCGVWSGSGNYPAPQVAARPVSVGDCAGRRSRWPPLPSLPSAQQHRETRPLKRAALTHSSVQPPSRGRAVHHQEAGAAGSAARSRYRPSQEAPLGQSTAPVVRLRRRVPLRPARREGARRAPEQRIARWPLPGPITFRDAHRLRCI